MNNNINKEFDPTIFAPNYFVRKELLQSIKELAPKLTGRLMDFGCGAKPYKSLFSVSEYIGVDYDGEGHNHNNEDIEVFYDGVNIPFDNETFDSIFSSEVLEHLFNPEDILKELNRVMKTGGKILLTCPFTICEHEVPIDFARYTSFAVKALLERNGFAIVEQRKTGTSVITIHQLVNTYLHLHINSKLKKIPIVRSAFRLIFYTLINVSGIILNMILPKSKDLYLNNIVLAQKVQR